VDNGDTQTSPRTATAPIPSFASRPPRAELYATGKALRDKCPRQSHAVWKAPRNRPDPVALVEESDKGRLPQLIPLRHGRMLQSPFTFYRGAALNMASDLAHTPATGVRVQCCGDAHLVNFRGLATPERRVIFEINDLDETLPAPWEWDVKRLATSFVVACRDNGLSERVAQDAVLTCLRAYRKRMAEYSDMRALDVWYDALEAEKLIAGITDAEVRERAARRLAKEKSRGAAEHDFPKLAHMTGEAALIRDNPPTIFHYREGGRTAWEVTVREAFASYRETLPPSVRFVLDRFGFKDVAIKVVGVGSVGTACFVVLLMAGDRDPLFSRSRRHAPPCWKRMPARASFPSTGSAWSMGTGSCRQRVTCFSAGRWAGQAATSTSANCGT
jgi:hypothetical protein